MNELKTLNMCDFCSHEIETCGANILKAREIDPLKLPPPASEAVIACDGYESPVDIIKKDPC